MCYSPRVSLQPTTPNVIEWHHDSPGLALSLRFLTNTESEMYQSCLEKIATLEARQRSERAREEATV